MNRCLLFLFALATTVMTSAADLPAFKAGVFSPPRLAPDFSLQGSNGSELRLSAYRGSVVVLAFGFTSCRDVCPVTLATLAMARRRLGTEAAAVQVLYITIDPEVDDAERMRSYLASYDTSFIGGTGDAARIAAVRRDYGILATRKEPGSHQYAHSSFTYLIDRDGRLRALMPYGHSPDDYAHDLRLLMSERK
jgi:protein SCO1/2